MMGEPFPGRWSFKYHPWLREMHNSTAEHNIGQKSAQMGYTETVLNITFYNIDILGVSCLYVLPALSPDAYDFSNSRFNPALETSPYLSNLFVDVQNIKHKRAGKANLFIRGSRSRPGLKSIPTGLVVLDEVDEMDQDNIKLAYERASGQRKKAIWEISTPTYPEHGINERYLKSTKEKFFFKCPSCSRHLEFIFPDCIEMCGENEFDVNTNRSFYKCNLCQTKLPQQTKPDYLGTGVWIKEQVSDKRGFYVNQMYSSTVSPGEFTKAYFRSLESPGAEQEFWNSKLGLPKIVGDAALTMNIVEANRKNYTKLPNYYGKKFVTMGVDVGNQLHYVINSWDFTEKYLMNDPNSSAIATVINWGTLINFEDLDKLFQLFGIYFCVLDANPERRKAREFANRHYGRVRMCTYAPGQLQRIITPTKEEDLGINVDRTSWLDMSLNRFRKNTVNLPMDIDNEFKTHMTKLVRIYSEDKQGNQVCEYEKIGADHYAHAFNYAEIALPFVLDMGTHQNIKY